MTTRFFATLGVLGCLLLGAPAYAQDASGIILGEIEKNATTSPDEKLTYAETSNREIDEALKAVEELLNSAEDTKARECITSRKSSITALKAVGQQAQSDMQAAFDRQDLVEFDHHFRKVAVAVSRTRMLRSEAERCVTGEQVSDGVVNINLLIENDLKTIEDYYFNFDDQYYQGGVDFQDNPPDKSPYLTP